jgi:hypothetical protein
MKRLKVLYLMLFPAIILGNLKEGSRGEIEVRKIGASQQEVIIDFSLRELGYEMVDTKGGRFLRLILEDAGVTNEIGNPLLPVKREFVEVPLGAEVEVTILKRETEFERIEGTLLPVQPPRPKIKEVENKIPFAFNEKTYSSRNFYPDNLVKIEEVGIIRGHRLILLEVYPIRYNPAKGIIEIARSIRVRLNFKRGDIGGTISGIRKKYSIPFESMLKDLVINYGYFGEMPPPPGNAPLGYLVIVPDEWSTDILPFVDWKRVTGYEVRVAYTSQTGSDTTSIRNYILNQYNDPSWNLTYILLVGDVDRIPNWVDQSVSSDPATDLYYSTLDGNDYLPDVYIGRFSVQNTTQLQTVVEKVVGYESTTSWSTTDWLERAFFLASADPGNHGVAEGTHLYCMNIVRNYGMVADSIFAYYDPVNPTIIANHINSGYSQVTYSGHGSESGWADSNNLTFSVNDIYNLLSNGYMIPFVQTYACLSGRYTVGECFSEAWLRAPGKGGVASMASSVTSYWDEDDILQRRIYDEWFDSSYTWVMGLINEGKLELLAHYGNTSTVRRYFDMYNLMGEPSLDVYTNIATNLVVSAPSAIPLGPFNAQVTVYHGRQPVEGAYVAFLRDSTIFGAGFTDNFGQVTIPIQVQSAGDVILSVTFHNAYPYFDTIPAISEGPYVAFLDYSIDDSGGDGFVNPGETINMLILAKNYGNDTAFSVYGILEESDPFITITSDSQYYGNILPGDSVWSLSPYSFTVDLSAPDEHNISFTLTFRDINDSAWVSNFTVPVYAPVMRVSGFTVDDSLQGNNNGVAEPGETIELYLGIRNEGHMDLNSVSAILSSGANYLTFLTDSAYFGDIPAGSTVFNSEPYVISIDSLAPSPSFPIIITDISGEGGFSFQDSFMLYVGRTGLVCFVEDDTIGWTHGGTGDLWHVSTRRYKSPMHSFYNGNEASGQYNNNMDAYLQSPLFILGPNSTLSFWTWYSIESGWDFGYVEISTDSGVTWTQLAQYTGYDSTWHRVTIDLSSYPAGTPAILRFRFTSDGSVTREGWYIDNIAVEPPPLPAALGISQVNIDDSGGNNNGIWDPGETVVLWIELYNSGGEALDNVEGTLITSDTLVTIIDGSSFFGHIGPDSAVMASDSIVVEASSSIPYGAEINFSFIVEGSPSYLDTLSFSLPVGDITALPSGPDGYGYYIYDSRDQYFTEAPDYNWIEINPDSGGPGTLIPLSDDQTVTIPLPFTFQFYGQEFTQVSICSNGWIGLGTNTSTTFTNTGIPNSNPPNGMIAAFWDDLNPSSTGSGKVYYYSDPSQGMFIVEYSGVYHFASSQRECFEVIFFDPSMYPTATGDGEVIVQYKLPPAQDDFTVGIENMTGTDGIQYYYDGNYDEHASTITGEFAIKFTTDEPTGIDEATLSSIPRRFALLPAYPNPFRNKVTIRFALPKKTNVELNIYNIAGMKVRTLIRNEMEPGYHQVIWNGKDDRGRRVSSGIYFYRLETKEWKKARKMILLR